MPDPLLVARNPDPDSSLPFLVRIPLGDGIVLRARETWPRASKVYCHRAEAWPADAEIDLVTRLRQGEQAAASEVFLRYTHRLLGLARKHLDARLAAKVEPEDIVQSAYKSFFQRHQDGENAHGKAGDVTERPDQRIFDR